MKTTLFFCFFLKHLGCKENEGVKVIVADDDDWLPHDKNKNLGEDLDCMEISRPGLK